MTEKKLHEYFPELSVMDFNVLCNIAYHGEIPSSYAIRNIASCSRANVGEVSDALTRLRRTPYIEGTKVAPRYFFKVAKEDWKGAIWDKLELWDWNIQQLNRDKIYVCVVNIRK